MDEKFVLFTRVMLQLLSVIRDWFKGFRASNCFSNCSLKIRDTVCNGLTFPGKWMNNSSQDGICEVWIPQLLTVSTYDFFFQRHERDLFFEETWILYQNVHRERFEQNSSIHLVGLKSELSSQAILENIEISLIN